MPAKPPSLLERVRRLCLAKPDTEESSRLGGEPHFYVGGKIFAGCGAEDGRWCVGMKVGLDLQAILITRQGFRVAKYVGKHGWITVDESALADDDELARLIERSYELIVAGGKPAKGKAKARGKAKPKPRAVSRAAAKSAARKPKRR